MVTPRAAGWTLSLVSALLIAPLAWAADAPLPVPSDEEDEETTAPGSSPAATPAPAPGAAPATAGTPAPAGEEAKPQEPPPPFAHVGGKEISGMDYVMSLERGVRQKFYHGKVPQQEMAQFQRDVGAKLIDRVLLQEEADKRGIKADDKTVEEMIAQYDKRYADSPMWKQNREAMLPGLRQELTTRSVVSQLEKQVRGVPEPTEEQVQAYYDSHPDKFTEPEDQKVSLILLKVDPGAGPAAWQAAQEQATDLVKRLRAGKADFAELAQLHSGDATAEKGGKMGTMHKGTLAEPAEAALAKIQPGEITDPVVVLEGVAIFRLEDRAPAEKIPLAKAKPRATDLLKRELSEQAWTGLLAQLRAATTIQINEKDYYLPLAPEPPATGAGAKSTKPPKHP